MSPAQAGHWGQTSPAKREETRPPRVIWARYSPAMPQAKPLSVGLTGALGAVSSCVWASSKSLAESKVKHTPKAFPTSKWEVTVHEAKSLSTVRPPSTT